MAIAASRCCQKLLTMLLRHVAGEPKVWRVVRVPSEVDEDRRQLQWQGGWPASRLVVTSDTLQYMERRPLRATPPPGPWGAQTSSAMPTSAPAASSHRGFHGVRRTSPTVSSVSRYPRQSWFTARRRIHPLASIRPSVIGVRPRRRARPSAAWGCRVSRWPTSRVRVPAGTSRGRVVAATPWPRKPLRQRMIGDAVANV